MMPQLIGHIGRQVILEDDETKELELWTPSWDGDVCIAGASYKFVRKARLGDEWWAGINKPALTREDKLENALKAVLQAFQDNDTSEDKSHPWIPGSDAKRVQQLICDALNSQERVIQRCY